MHASAARLWDIFCRVIDNHGDLGVCWRLARDLAAHGQQVRLWVDDAAALPWLAPGALQGQVAGVQVLPWTSPLRHAGLPPAQVWVEAFGCTIDPEFIAEHQALKTTQGAKNTQTPTWINLEYLSAEAYVERMHALPSPVLTGPAAGWTKWFFYPGFTPRTGGLLREADLPARQADFDRAAWLARHGIAWRGERLVSLFCYEPTALTGLADALLADGVPTRLLVTAGRAAAAWRALTGHESDTRPTSNLASLLQISYLPYLPQTGYDELLWACQLNLVRGEDSLVRALWAGAAFVWQLYPQDDDAHHAKLGAFLDWLDAPPTLRRFMRVWNGVEAGALPPLDLTDWRRCAQAARARLQAQPDLCTQLLGFVREKS